MNVPDDLKYAESHEWVRMDGDVATVGITDHAQAELTDIVFVEPPKVGDSVDKGAGVAVVESVKAASDIYAPVSGEILEANAALDSDPALLNTDPFGDGWIYKVKLSDAGELEALKSPEDYREQIS